MEPAEDVLANAEEVLQWHLARRPPRSYLHRWMIKSPLSDDAREGQPKPFASPHHWEPFALYGAWT